MTTVLGWICQYDVITAQIYHYESYLKDQKTTNPQFTVCVQTFLSVSITHIVITILSTDVMSAIRRSMDMTCLV